MKFPKCTYPPNHSENDFKCFGPAAVKDDSFEGTCIADLGCFNQDSGVDSNKRYHGCVCQSSQDGKWYFYTEWTRTGNSSVQFQFETCSSRDDAQRKYIKQMESKNIKRGAWTQVGGMCVLRPKVDSKGNPKDLYVVRPLKTRTSGLPDGRNIVAGDVDATSKSSKRKTKSTKHTSIDKHTADLLRDMSVGVQSYTRASIVGGDIPSQEAIDEARDILFAAQNRLTKVGPDDQLNDSELNQLTGLIYGRVPKVKPRGASASSFVLTRDNISLWQQDLDAFESAGQTVQTDHADADPYGGMNISMEWLDPSSSGGEFIRHWMPEATAHKHSHVGYMNIKNVWKIERGGVSKKFVKKQKSILKSNPIIDDRPSHQPKCRIDLSDDQKDIYKSTNTALLFHGTRSVNVMGIMREGLRLPKQLVGVVITAAMFGPGTYFADDWKKSAGYTSLRGSLYSSGSGGIRGRGAFMFVADVALGQMHLADGPKGYTSPPRGTHSIFGKARHSSVAHNEFITFDNDQNQLTYLVEFST